MVARTVPHALRSLHLADEQIVELTMQCDLHDDLVGPHAATSNRVRVVWSHLNHPALLHLLQHHPSPLC